MYRPAKEVRIRKVQNAQGGDGEVTFYDWLLPDEAPGHGRVFSKLVIPPGCSIGKHVHQGEFEAVLVLSGVATIDDNGQEVTLYPGDMNCCKNGDYHSTANNGDEELVMMALIMTDLEKEKPGAGGAVMI